MRPLRGSQQLEPAPAKLPDSRKVDRPDGILAGVTELPAAFTELVGCRLPVQLAPMGGGVGGPELAVAVCRAGGLGMLSASHPMPVADQLRQVRAQTAAPVGVGFFTFDLPARMADLETAASLARVVDLFWGDPDAAVVERIHAGGALAFWQVGSCEEATAAADAGCDAVVAQGVEAGGHVRGTTPLLELLEQVVARAPVPVVAAGGIAAADRVRHVFAAGASAVRVGTRISCPPRLPARAACREWTRHGADHCVRRRVGRRATPGAARRPPRCGYRTRPGRPRGLSRPGVGRAALCDTAALNLLLGARGGNGDVRRYRC
jgi:hypothetical protein